MAKKSLLMVDQDAYYAGIYANRFESAGWNVRVEENIAAAKKRLKRCAPDVLIVDLEPIDEVLAFLRDLRTDPKTEKTLQIALTKLGDRKMMREALQAGVDSYLLKGHFVPSEAVKKVKRLLEEKTSV
ncbi:MAG: response regulator [Candidatus Uhrbacteria bacterium]|nr:response regulator [Candidatus Uhrbacteria bacterium]